ncbi:hypothetical protein NUW54_g14641 [Trametes sanguinea]|uniref:Uncharacterized protein n=1 Tax=Trametes sanguinea TaxID=158606 RepID=A0ACC1MD43_9APHY|nr:hypothetical protein NUW54_g14641 [Trametes sanguinea]
MSMCSRLSSAPPTAHAPCQLGQRLGGTACSTPQACSPRRDGGSSLPRAAMSPATPSSPPAEATKPVGLDAICITFVLPIQLGLYILLSVLDPTFGRSRCDWPMGPTARVLRPRLKQAIRTQLQDRYDDVHLRPTNRVLDIQIEGSAIGRTPCGPLYTSRAGVVHTRRPR